MFSFRLRTRICRDKKGVPSMAATNWGMKWDITPPTRIRQAMEMQAEVERRKCAQVLESEGKKQAQILELEGKKTAQIFESEGDDFITLFIF
ncbi:hypothetical protein ZEAMMB73_Zm00001d006190 [Zea mays]|uniref:Uncharacterized protein n=1 Tax=Zea mays TaxID=4577 RepID=A0A1D6ETJ2_MAIZE|nr:hypothetical protein ZEAMMB73_Zm00001d006190 [Zea mays]